MDTVWWAVIVIVVIVVLLCLFGAFVNDKPSEHMSSYVITSYLDMYKRFGPAADLSAPGPIPPEVVALAEEESRVVEERNDMISKEPMIIVFVASYNEEKTIAKCLKTIVDSVRASKYAPLTKIVLLDSNSTDRTQEIAKGYVDKVVNCPKGKLNARHYGYLRENCDIIVCADADRLYDTDWFDGLVRPLVTGEAVATTGVHFKGSEMMNEYIDKNKVPFNGGNSAFTRDVYLKSPFNLNVNQNKFMSIWHEEEVRFAESLKKYGNVKFVPQASYDDMRNLSILQNAMRYMGWKARTF